MESPRVKVMQHTIEAAAEARDAYELCVDVERWPEIFPPCRAARVIEQDGRSQLVEISALANGQPMTWRSMRELSPETLAVSFRQVQPSPLLASMEGAWRFFPSQGGALIALEHRFAVKPDVRGIIDSVSTPEEALDFMSRSVHGNSQRELSTIKRFLERKTSPSQASELYGEIEDEMTIAAPAAPVYDLLFRASDWPSLLPHCHAVDMRYDDGRDQEFIMTVDVRSGREHIRSIRHCVPHRSITYFQPEPPPVLARHTGQWLLEPIAGGVRVVSWHGVELRPEGVKKIWGDIDPRDALARVRAAISENSRGTMLAIKKRLEGG